MRIEFELEEVEYREASRAMARAGKDWFRPMRVAGYIGAAAGFALLFGSDIHNCVAPVLLILLGLFIPIYPAWGAWRKLDKGWQKFVLIGTLAAEFSDEALLYESIYSTTRYSWYAFDRFIETSRLFLIFRGEQPLIIPKRPLLEQQGVAAVRKMLERIASRPGPAFAVKI